MNKTIIALATGAAALIAAAGAGTAAYAHHAFAAEFDANAPVLLKGKVVRFEWVNPHAWIHITVPDTDSKGKPKKGTTMNWAVEGGTTSTLLRMGFNKSSLPAGTEIVVRGYQSRDGYCGIDPKTKATTCKANGRDVTFPNGCKLFVGSSAPADKADPAEAEAQNKCAAK